MNRIKGTDGVSLIECVNPNTSKWRVRWDARQSQEMDEQGKRSEGVTYMEHEFLYKPELVEIKELIMGWFNKQIDAKIRSGFVWNELPVWLSTENQFNYKAAYDLAIQTGGATLPVTFKFGTDETPMYHEFNTLNELTDFYTKSMGYVQGVLESGWSEKDAFDLEPYQI